jgi:hypothetical protein
MSDLEFDPMDASNAPGGGSGTWLPVGKHIATIVNHELGEASTGTPYLELWMEDSEGRSHHERFSLHANARWKLAAVFKAVGHTAKINLSQNGAIKKALYIKRFQVTIDLGRPSERTGKAYREARFFDPVPVGQAPSQRQAAAPPPAPHLVGDDDIPF